MRALADYSEAAELCPDDEAAQLELAAI